MTSIIVMLGTKAQFVKLAPVLLELEAFSTDYCLVYTGQHNETFEDLQRAFGTRNPDYRMTPEMEASTKARFLKWCIAFWRSVFRARFRALWRSANAIVVHGDTMSTLFGALVGRLFRLEVVHVEAGLRSPKLFNPFPEEIIRRLVSRVSSVHFCPDDWSASNLSRLKGEKIVTPGNTLLDSLALALDHSRAERLQRNNSGEHFAVVSMHRVENLNDREAFECMIQTMIDVSEIVPLHFVLHPATREALKQTGWMARLEQVNSIWLRPRTDYFSFVKILLQCDFLMTDGGSNQEEASMLGLPCLLLRKYTERRDGLDSNVVLSDLNPERIVEFARKHARQHWMPRGLPDVSPSRMIVETLVQKYAQRA